MSIVALVLVVGSGVEQIGCEKSHAWFKRPDIVEQRRGFSQAGLRLVDLTRAQCGEADHPKVAGAEDEMLSGCREPFLGGGSRDVEIPAVGGEHSAAVTCFALRVMRCAAGLRRPG